MDIVDELIRGREAFRRHEWQAARDRLSAPDLATLDPADLHALATAAYLVGDTETCVRAWQRVVPGAPATPATTWPPRGTRCG